MNHKLRMLPFICLGILAVAIGITLNFIHAESLRYIVGSLIILAIVFIPYATIIELKKPFPNNQADSTKSNNQSSVSEGFIMKHKQSKEQNTQTYESDERTNIDIFLPIPHFLVLMFTHIKALYSRKGHDSTKNEPNHRE